MLDCLHSGHYITLIFACTKTSRRDAYGNLFSHFDIFSLAEITLIRWGWVLVVFEPWVSRGRNVDGGLRVGDSYWKSGGWAANEWEFSEISMLEFGFGTLLSGL